MKLNQCPVCGSSEIKPQLKAQDFLVSREYFEIYSCKKCQVRFTNPRPDELSLGKYYESDEYISHTNQGTSLVNSLYKIARNFTLRKKLKLINKFSGNKRLLDVGCGTGHFISYCQQCKWQVSGVEPNASARNMARQNSQCTIYADITSIQGQKFDVITLWHVLEHLPDLDKTITSLKKLLEPKGIIIVAVPNYTAYEEKVFLEYWAAYDVPRHLYHFNKMAMDKLTTKHGLKIEKEYPMWLDSYYISLLSNKHKYGRNKYINSFITGSLSNIYGIKSGNFSSLIYQLSNHEVS